MLSKIEKELLLKKLIQKTHQKLYLHKKVSFLDILNYALIPGKLIYIILKPDLLKNFEHTSGICINKKRQGSQTSIQILNITLNMKIIQTFLITSPLFFLCTILVKKKIKTILIRYKNKLNKLYYLKQQKIKHLRTSIIIKTLL